MSAHTTLLVTAKEARKILMSKLLEASDEQLVRMMDEAFYDNLFNFSLVSEYPVEDEQEPTPTVRNHWYQFT